MSTTITSPVSLAFDAKGNLFVASSTAVAIYAPPYTGTPQATVPITGSLAGFAVDPRGDIFIAQAVAGAAIEEFAPPWDQCADRDRARKRYRYAATSRD